MTAWTPELLVEARQLWDEGYSANLIGDKLDLTKGQIIGQAYRLKWGQRQPLHGRPGTPEAWLRPPPVPVPAQAGIKSPGQAGGGGTHAPKPKPPPPNTPPTLLDLKPHQCKWPVNEPPKGGTYLFCGEPQAVGSYCREHAGVGFAGTKRQQSTAGWQPRQTGF